MDELSRSAREVNPYAGHHRVTADPAAIQACETATAISFADYPYWTARFAARAEAFSHSDSGWLVLEAHEGAEHCERQVLWLARVLASRGMPRLLMESHLVRLADELERAGCGDPVAPEALRVASAELRRRRTRVIPDDVAHEICARFDSATADVTGPGGRAVPRCGTLIVSAVCDEPEVPEAVGSLVDWLGDPDRFPASWIDAVTRALEESYAAAKG